MDETQRARRNLNPSKEAIAGRWLYHKRYAEQRGGTMDFYDSLTASEKKNCKQMVKDIEKATWNSQ